MVYEDLLAGADFGTIIIYPVLDALLGREFRANRAPIYRAREELGAMRHRWLEAVPGVGYRVVEASEHMRLANGRKQQARRQLHAMVRIGNATDLNALTPDQLLEWDRQHHINMRTYQILNSHEQRLARIEQVLHREGLLKT